jgi:hypothetical protein
MEEHPVSRDHRDAHREGTVDLSSTSDAYFVKEFDRKDAYLKQMNQFHNHGIKASTAKFAVKDGKLFEFACGKVVIWVGGSRRATVRSSAATSSGQLGQSRAGSTRMINTDVKVPMVFFQMDAATRMHPPLDEITDAMLTSKHPEILSALWNIDKDANPALDKFKGLPSRDSIPSVVSRRPLPLQNRRYLDRFVNNVAYTTKVGGHFIGTTFDGDTVAAQLKKNSGKITGLETLSWNIERVYEEPYTEGTGQMVDVYVETIGQVLREYLVSFKTLTQRLKSQGFELVETYLPPNVQEDPEMKEMINAMDPVVRFSGDEPLVCIQKRFVRN